MLFLASVTYRNIGMSTTWCFAFFFFIGTVFDNAYATNTSKNNLQLAGCFFSVFS